MNVNKRVCLRADFVNVTPCRPRRRVATVALQNIATASAATEDIASNDIILARFFSCKV